MAERWLARHFKEGRGGGLDPPAGAVSMVGGLIIEAVCPSAGRWARPTLPTWRESATAPARVIGDVVVRRAAGGVTAAVRDGVVG